MNKVTEILGRIELGDRQAADELLPLVYAALRKLAAQKMARERPGQTLQATALVHEAYVRLLDQGQVRHWASRGHFYVAAGEAMRRILVEQARRRKSDKRGGALNRVAMPESLLAVCDASDELPALHEALEKLEAVDPQAAELVKLRFFAGLSGKEAAQALKMPSRSADRLWAYARSFLFRELYPHAAEGGPAPGEDPSA